MPGKTPWRNKLASYVERQEKRRSDGLEPSGLHSRSYHRYFEGYTEVLRLRPDGRRRIERIYTGAYHRQNLTGTQRVTLRILYVLLWGLAVGCFLLCASRDVASNRAWYVTVPEAVAMAALFWTACALFNYLTAPESLTIHDYRSTSGSLKRSSLTASIASGVVAAATLIHCLLHLGDSSAAELTGALLGLMAAVLLLVIYGVERRVPYLTVENEQEPPEGGTEIT